MTKPFSAVAAILVAGLGLPAHADEPFSIHDILNFPDRQNGLPLRSGFPAPVPVFPLTHAGDPGTIPLQTQFVPPPSLADLPDWILDRVDASEEYIALLHWSSTRPETWGSESVPYHVAVPGPHYVGLIPRPIPEGWVVTNRCLAWDDTYTSAERPNGDCYIFEMREMVIGPAVTD